MTLEETISFAQENFGEDNGLPLNVDGRPTLPTWLEDRAGAIEKGPADDFEIDGNIFPELDSYPQTSGIDELAYYLPFHFYKKDWGTYVRFSGILFLAQHLAYRGRFSHQSLMCAFKILIEHERMHFLAEIASSRIELISGFESYEEYFKNIDAGFHEEAIANASAVRTIRNRCSDRTFKKIQTWMKEQGSGYKDFGNWVSDDKFQLGLRDASNSMSPPISNIKLTSLPKFDWKKRPGEFLFDHAATVHPPLYFVLDQPAPWLRIVRKFRKEFELQVLVHRANEHKPAHIHVNFLDQNDPKNNRYKWNSLDPLRRPNGQRSSNPTSKQKKDLKKYVDK